MKRLIMTAIMLNVAHSYAQTTNLTFQWHGQTMGVYFEATNLTASVKRAIRDDIAYSLSLIPTNNVTFEILPPTNPDSANYTGIVSIHRTTPINYCEGILCFYKTVGGNIYWEIDTEASSKYLVAIALTNQYAAAIHSFSNFYHNLITGFDTTGMTLAEKKAFFWGPYANEVEQEMGAEFEPAITATLSLRPFPDWTFPPKPSILAFSKWPAGKIDDLPTPDLLCLAKRCTSENKSTKWPFVYVKGK
jgi:hypothetical protein